MFQAGAVAPSSVFLLQLLIGPVLLDAVDPPVFVGLKGRAEGMAEDNPSEGVEMGDRIEVVGLRSALAPVVVGLKGLLRLPPIVVGNLAGSIVFATLLKAPRHCKT